ncbi:hypothetical protein F5X68DRAFT_739 [Plectosphaerella plurivora]|uniref:Uncharacterized protein n=1 Tax=Plectosphaerella plurivora TaxID=936078 RepID=A0A9P8VNU7_9PEZI|nr:hypothetical protein F5X68DRAFT_739 [Plectosphaerella plurivora]
MTTQAQAETQTRRTTNESLPRSLDRRLQSRQPMNRPRPPPRANRLLKRASQLDKLRLRANHIPHPHAHTPCVPSSQSPCLHDGTLAQSFFPPSRVHITSSCSPVSNGLSSLTRQATMTTLSDLPCPSPNLPPRGAARERPRKLRSLPRPPESSSSSVLRPICTKAGQRAAQRQTPLGASPSQPRHKPLSRDRQHSTACSVRPSE